MKNNYEGLEVYQLSYKLALEIHKESLKFPREIQFDLADQVRRSSKSVPTNIAEGYGRRAFEKDYKRFLWMAVGSKHETIVHINFLKDLSYIKEDLAQKWIIDYEKVGRMLYGLIQSIQN